MKMMTINLLFVQIALPILKTKMISPWCNHHHEKNPRKKSVNLQQNAELLNSYQMKRTSSLARPNGHAGTRCVREFA